MLELQEKVLEWANERDLLKNKNRFKQFGKLDEEKLELYLAVLDNNEEEIIDAIGDIQVVLIILAKQLGVDYNKCLESAYNVIKNRTGKTVDGTFVKD